ncbi:MAG: hypothetical protein ACRDTT_14415, partial [Pseudonocardiaceae bacterium]
PTLSRLNTGHRIDISGYAGCCRWLDVPLDTFITPRTSQHQPPARGDLSAELLALFQDHGIPEVHRRALHDLVTQLAPAPEDPA